MNIIDSLKSVLGGSTSTITEQEDLMSTVMNYIGGQKGGLNGLVQQFNSKGLGNVISSWIGTGKNMPITQDQIQNVLGSDTIKGLASKIGMDTNTLTSQLSNILPDVVDKLTPDGKIPEGDILTKGKELLSNLFGRK